jgi:DNA-binding MltR family transcriptional regulator
MSKRGDELRRLMRIPPPADVKLILDSFDKESDRAAALVAGSLLDTALERLVRQSLKTKDKEIVNLLFQQRGPMGDFHSKILIARGFGVIDAKVAFELNVVRSVRNVFAHATANLSFDTPEIRAAIERSELTKVLFDAVLESLKEEFGEREVLRSKTSKAQFFALVRLLFSILDNMQKELGGAALSG